MYDKTKTATLVSNTTLQFQLYVVSCIFSFRDGRRWI